MGTHSILRKLTNLGIAISTVSHIDPVVKAEMEGIPQGTRIGFLFPVSLSHSSLVFTTQGYGFELSVESEEVPPTVTFQIFTRKTTKQLFRSKLDLFQAIAKGDITLQGPSAIALSVIRTLQLSLPYTIGPRKTRNMVPSYTPPIHFWRRRMTYRFLQISPIKKGHPVEENS